MKKFKKQLRIEAAKQLSCLTNAAKFCHCEAITECNRRSNPIKHENNEIATLHTVARNDDNSFAQQTEKDLSLFTSHLSHKRYAFTLAEVLITLGIIGVVAALTIPTLVANHRKSVAVQKLKKISSSLLQAQTQANIDIGEVRPAFEPQNPDDALEMFNTYYKPYINFTEIKKGDKGVFGYMQDGTAIYFFKNRNCANAAWACTYIAVCLTHEVCDNLDESKITGDSTRGLLNGKDSFGLYTDGRIPVDVLVHYSHSQRINSCKNKNFEACSALIFEAGWQIPKDYPIKF